MKASIIPRTYKGNGDSLWGCSDGVYSVTDIEVNYLNWVSYPNSDMPIHAGVTLRGPNTERVQYTDSGIDKRLSEDKVLMAIIQRMITELLSNAGIKREVPPLNLCWSEYGLQPEKGWNFDAMPSSKYNRLIAPHTGK